MDLKALSLNKINEMIEGDRDHVILANFSAEVPDAASQADNYSLYDLDTNIMQTLVDETNNVMDLDVSDLAEQLTEHNQMDFDDIILCSDQYIDENISADMNFLSFEDIKTKLQKNNVERLELKKCYTNKLTDQNLREFGCRSLVSDDENVENDIKHELPYTSNESGNDILDLDKDTIQSLIKYNFIDINFDEIDECNNSKDPSEVDIEGLLKVNKILKNTNEIFNATIDEVDPGKLEIEITPRIIADVQKATANDSFPIISIHSDNDSDDTDSECEGYHSSDFEFITESEAELQGLITNYPKNKFEKVSSSPKKSQNHTSRNTQKTSVVESMPGTSRDNAEYAKQDLLKYWSRSYTSSLRAEQYKRDLKKNRETHEIPQGEGYLNLFRGYYASTSVFLENKSVMPTACMQVHKSMGFSIMKPLNDDLEEPLDDQTIKEAEENARKILARYPTENRRRRRY